MTLPELFRAIATDPRAAARIIEAQPEMASAPLVVGATREDPELYFIPEISHYMYAGDTALHLAAAAHRTSLIGELVACGAAVDAINRRRQQPLHYAVDGSSARQVATIEALLAAGADPNAIDMGGVTPLHRAVRNRRADAVEVLLARGADPRRKNKSGSTALALARMTTGKSGSGSAEAKAEQARILKLLG